MEYVFCVYNQEDHAMSVGKFHNLSLIYSVSQNKVPPSEKKILKILLVILELFYIFDINIYVVVYHQCKYQQVWPFNFGDMTKFVRVPKISLVPTYPIHVHLKTSL